MRSSRRRRVVFSAALIIFIVGFALLYQQSHGANARRTVASRSVQANAERYAAAVVAALRAGPVTGSQLLTLREQTYRDGGGLSQGISHVGASVVGRNLLVTYQIQVNFRGSFHAAARALTCYYARVSTRSVPPSLASFHPIECRHLLPAPAPTARLRPA